MLKIQEYVDIKNYCTLKIGGQFRYFAIVKSEDEIKEALEFIEKNNTHIFMLGGGSNLLFTDGVLDALAIKIEIKGFEVLENTDHFVIIKIGAGENWDHFVSRACATNLSGIEAMSAIPGTVGATPVQNVGAYGQEVKDTIVSVDVFDIENKKIKTLTNTECKFLYRDSIFKNEGKGKFIIISVTFKLSKHPPEIPKYIDVKKYFIENNINNPSLLQIRNAIIDIRNIKLPNPKKIPNVGSFFKNPIMEKSIALKIKDSFPDMPSFSAISPKATFGQEVEFVKIPAGWLIEKAGLKGKDFGNVSSYEKNALVLVNNSNATYKDIMSARDLIIKTVYEKFSITLEQEPETVS